MENEIKNESQEEMKEAEVEIESTKTENEVEIKEKTKSDFYFEMVLFLILGLLLGVVIKTEASKRVTMGFNDYKVSKMEQGVDFKKAKEDLIKKKAQETQNQNEGAGIPSGENGSCGI